MASNSKDTIYIDAEEEITAIIDKVQSSESAVVALVVPKKTSVLQSSINMKLLKRSTEQVAKTLVLITSDDSLKALAANNQIYVAKDLNSKPYVPDLKSMTIKDNSNDLESLDELKSPSIDLNQYQSAANLPVEQKLDQIASQIPVEEDDQQEELSDNGQTEDNVVDLSQDDYDQEPLPEKASYRRTSYGSSDNVDQLADKNIKVPSFSRFKIIILAIVTIIVLLIAFIYYIFAILPHATIRVQTDALYVHLKAPVNLDSFQSSSSATSGVFYTKQASYSKSNTQSIPTTGTINNGKTASGTVTISLNNCDNLPVTIPSGTIVSYGSFNYTIDQPVNFTVVGTNSNGQCQTNSPQIVDVTAVAAGSNYNLAFGQKMLLATFNGYPSSQFKVFSEGINGGTDNVEKVVAQADITNLDAKLSVSSSGAKNALEVQLESEGFYPLSSTFKASKPQITYSAQLNQPASTLSATEKITYTMIGIDSSELKNFLNSLLKAKITSSSQTILNNGYHSLSFSAGSSPTNLNLSTTGEIGPNLKISQIQKLAAGHTSQYIIENLKKNPNIKKVTVTITPSFLSTAPSNINKIKVIIQKP